MRSVARINEENGDKIVCKNNFTSLIRLPEWSFDAQSFAKNAENMEEEDDGIYTPLNELLVMSTGTLFFNSQMNAQIRFTM